jgi:SAM-dependent methyltransferase
VKARGAKAGSQYGDDLAYIHHEGFGDFARDAGPGLLALLREAGIDDGVVIDLGCGSGIWLRDLIRSGYSAAGVDPSPAMIRLARKVAPSAALHRASAWDLDLPPCDAVTALGDVLGYLPSGRGRAPSFLRLFRRVAASLRPGGLFLFDLLVEGRGGPMEYRSWGEGRDWTVLIDVEEDVRRRRLTREITTFRRVNDMFRRSSERHVLRVARRDEVERDLRKAGFSVRVMRRYGDMELPQRRLAFRARRRD